MKTERMRGYQWLTGWMLLMASAPGKKWRASDELDPYRVIRRFVMVRELNIKQSKRDEDGTPTPIRILAPGGIIAAESHTRQRKARTLKGYGSLSCWLVLIRLYDGVRNRWVWREMLHEASPYWAMHYAVHAANNGEAVCLCAPGGIIAAEFYPTQRKREFLSTGRLRVSVVAPAPRVFFLQDIPPEGKRS